jgi:hypothetical protein
LNTKLPTSHPDQCGGLKPLGDFCFNMSLPIIIGALATALVGIGGWILYFSRLGIQIYHAYFLNFYFNPIVAYFSIGILVLAVTPLLYITFFLSLKFVHEAMEARKRQAQDEFADQVGELESRIPELASRTASLEAARKELDQLEILRAAYPPKGYPSWPFRPSLAIALFSPQILGVISLLLTFWQIMKD